MVGRRASTTIESRGASVDTRRWLASSSLEVVESSSFLRELESLPSSESTSSSDDWAAYFSDPKNRNIF